jgi:hypothetical protein
MYQIQDEWFTRVDTFRFPGSLILPLTIFRTFFKLTKASIQNTFMKTCGPGHTDFFYIYFCLFVMQNAVQRECRNRSPLIRHTI